MSPGKRLIALAIAMVPPLIAGTVAIERVALDGLTVREAAVQAGAWGTYLAATDATIDIGRPIAAWPAIDEAQSRLADVVGYTIVDRSGVPIFSTGSTPAVFEEALDPSMVRGVVVEGTAEALVERRGSWFAPTVFSLAYAPIVVDGEVTAVALVYADQTARYRAYIGIARPVEAGLYLLVMLAFLLPGLAWYRQLVKRREADAYARHQGDHDWLTGIANRRKISAEMTALLGDPRARNRRIAVLNVDIDNFKDVNDTLGHDAGDLLLKSVATRLTETVGDRGIVGRLGGDEFVIIQLKNADDPGAKALAEEVMRTLSVGYRLNGHDVMVAVSIGYTTAKPRDGSTADRLFKCADLALHRAKSDGRARAQMFQPVFDVDFLERHKLERTVRNAIVNKALRLHYQPLYDRQSKSLTGFEALVRLTAEDSSLIAPTVFIPVAERIGLIDRIGNWVLREACRTAVTWPENLIISVNLSPLQFSDNDLPQKVKAALLESGLKPQRLELEITESLLIKATDAVLRQLHELKEIGVSIVMDDFGTGYSSLAYLWQFPFDRIKIDGSFISAVGSADGVDKIIKTVVTLGRSLGMKVTVEGVENKAQAAFLDDIECDEVQGYFYGLPQPGIDLASVILNAYKGTIEKAQSGAPARGATPVLPDRPPAPIAAAHSNGASPLPIAPPDRWPVPAAAAQSNGAAAPVPAAPDRLAVSAAAAQSNGAGATVPSAPARPPAPPAATQSNGAPLPALAPPKRPTAPDATAESNGTPLLALAPPERHSVPDAAARPNGAPPPALAPPDRWRVANTG